MASPLARRLTPKTLAQVLEESLQAQHLALLIKKGQVQDIVPYNVRPVPVEKVLDTIDKTVPDASFARALVLPKHEVQLETIGTEEKPVLPGDLVRAGALVRLSTLGLTHPFVQSYCVRLRCTNGAVSTDVIAEFGGDGDGGGNIWNWLKKSVRDAYSAIGNIVARWQSMAREEIRPEDRAAVLAALIKQARLSASDAEAVRTEALRNPPMNEYDMMNLLTWATSHVVEEPRAIVRAMDTAAQFASTAEHRRICPVCHRAR